jgi:YVTN family beta-propeller protein
MNTRLIRRLLLTAAVCAISAAAHAHEIYVPNYLDGDVSVLDAASLATLARIPVTTTADPSIPVAGEPSAVEFSRDHRLAFVAISNSDRVAVIDTEQRTVVQYIVIAPVTFDALIFLHPAGHRLYVTSCEDPVISIIDVKTRSTIGTIPLTGGSYPMAFAPFGRTAYLGNGYTGCGAVNGLYRINLNTNTPAGFIPLSQPVSDVAVAPHGLFALTTGGDRILVVNLLTQSEFGAVRCGLQPCSYAATGGIVFNERGTRAYTVDAVTNDFVTIDTDIRSRRFLQELSRVRIELPPDDTFWQLVVRKNRAYVIATDFGGPGTVVTLKISTSVPVVVTSGPVGTFAYELDIWPSPGSKEHWYSRWRWR